MFSPATEVRCVGIGSPLASCCGSYQTMLVGSTDRIPASALFCAGCSSRAYVEGQPAICLACAALARGYQRAARREARELGSA